LVANGDTVHFCNTAVANGNRNTYMNVSARSLPVIYGNVNMGATSINGGTSGAPTNQTLTMGVLGFDLATNNAANNLTIGSTALVYIPSTIAVNAGNRTIFLNSVISGAANAGLSIAGAVALTGANTYSGNTAITSGTTTCSTSGNVAATNLGTRSSSYTITISNGAKLSLAINSVLAPIANLTASGLHNIVLNGSANGATYLFASRYNGIGNITINSAWLAQNSTDTGSYQGYQFIGTVTSTGSSLISSGTNRGNHLNGLASTTFDVQSGTLNIDSTAPLLDGSGAQPGAGVLVKTGSGTLLLQATNTYTGGSTINAGTVKTNNLQALGTGAVTVTGSTSRLQTVSSLNGKLTIGGKLTMASSGILRIGG
jgi:autotransporter-associated beta strand protein